MPTSLFLKSATPYARIREKGFGLRKAGVHCTVWRQSPMNAPSNNDRSYRACFWFLVVGFAVFRLVLAGHFGLSTDESHYVMYSRRLAWGYFDHPPMVAFLAALTTWFGEGLFWYRLGPILCWSGSVILMRALVLTLYRDEAVAFWASVILMLMPVQHLLSIALLPDAPLNVFWCGALLASWHAFRGGRWGWWLLGGACIGGALLSKYHGVLLGLTLLGYLITSAETRRWLRTPKPYAAVLVGCLVFVPNILWNGQHA